MLFLQVGGSRLLVDLTTSEKAVHADFFNGTIQILSCFFIDSILDTNIESLLGLLVDVCVILWTIKNYFSLINRGTVRSQFCNIIYHNSSKLSNKL